MIIVELFGFLIPQPPYERNLPFSTAVVGYGGEEGKTRQRIWVGARLTLVRGDLWVGVASSCFQSFEEGSHCAKSTTGQQVT